MKKNSIILVLLISIQVLGQEMHNLSLQEAQNFALENNASVQNAVLDIKKAKKRVWEATATGLPQINAKVDYQYFIQQPVSLLPASAFDPFSQIRLLEEFYNLDQFQTQEIPTQSGGLVPVVFGTRQTLNAGATLSQLLFSGSYIVGLESAKAFKEISELSKEKVELVLKESVSNAYAAVLVANENIKIIEKNLAVSDKNLKEITEIYKVGLTEEQNVDQIKYSNTTLKTSLNLAKRQKETSFNTLKFIIGLQQEDDLVLSTKLQDFLAESLLIEEDRTENHIDLRLSQNNVTTSKLQVKFQKSMALPTLSTFLSSSYQANSDSFTFIDSDQRWFNTTLWGVSLDIPIFSSLSRKSKTDQAKIDLQKAINNRDRIEEEIKQNLNNSLLNYESALDNLKTIEELVALSKKIYDKEQIKFFEGISTSAELSNAENQFYNSESQYIQAIFQVIQTKNALLQAMGEF